jgi:hypothetical protein
MWGVSFGSVGDFTDPKGIRGNPPPPLAIRPEILGHAYPAGEKTVSDRHRHHWVLEHQKMVADDAAKVVGGD